MKLNEYISHIRNTYPKIGAGPTSFDDLINNITELHNLLPDGSTILNVYTSAMGDLRNTTAALDIGFAKVIGDIEKHNKQIESAIKNITFLENRNSELNKSFSMNSNAAEEFGKKLRNIGQIAGKLSFGDDAMFQSAIALKELNGNLITSTKIGAGYQQTLLKTQTILREQAGITDKNAIAFEQYSNQLGITGAQLLSIYKYGETGGLLDSLATGTGMKQSQVLQMVLEGIAETTSDIRYTTSKIPGNLEVAVLKAKALGISMEQLSKTGKGFLNIESSVGDELNYQMLTGQRLLDQDGNSITNQYRLAELQGDRSKQVKLMVDAITSQRELLKNPVNLEQFAKTFNIAESAVTDMIGQINVAKETGLDAVLTMTDPAKITEEVAKAKKAFIDANKGTADEFDQLAKDFLDNKDKIDNRTTVEQASEKHLASISANISAIAEAQGLTVARAKEGAEKLMDDNSALQKQKNIYATAAKDPNNKKVLKQIGGVALQKEISGVATDLKSQLDLGLQTPDTKRKKQEITDVESGFTSESGAALPSTYTPSGRMDGVGIKKTEDALIIPDRGPILQPAKNDVIAAFRPNDVIANTLNQTAMPSATTAPAIDINALATAITSAVSATATPAIDINALAAAITSAVSKIKVEATIKQDTFLGTTNMNNPRLFT